MLRAMQIRGLLYSHKIEQERLIGNIKCIIFTMEYRLHQFQCIWKYQSILVYSQVALVVKNPSANAGDIRDTSSILGWGISPGEGHSNLLQYSCLGNPMDRGAWWATVHGVAKSWTWLKQLSMHVHISILNIKNVAIIMRHAGRYNWYSSLLTGNRIKCHL